MLSSHTNVLSHVHGAPHKSHKAETAQMSTHGWMGKHNGVHPQMECDSAIKRNKALTAASMWTDPEATMLSGRGQTQNIPSGVNRVHEGPEQGIPQRQKGD